MIVLDLRKILSKLPDELEIVTASDDEGNSFRKVQMVGCSVEKFDSDMSIIAEEDYIDYEENELKDFVLIG